MARLNQTREMPPPLELACLKMLWTLGEGRVKDVREALCSDRQLAYTTVMTVLDRLVKRGGVRRRKVGRSYLYTPAVNRDFLCRLAVKDLVDTFFDGNEESLRAYLRIVPPVPPPLQPEDSRLDAALL